MLLLRAFVGSGTLLAALVFFLLVLPAFQILLSLESLLPLGTLPSLEPGLLTVRLLLPVRLLTVIASLLLALLSLGTLESLLALTLKRLLSLPTLGFLLLALEPGLLTVIASLLLALLALETLLALLALESLLASERTLRHGQIDIVLTQQHAHRADGQCSGRFQSLGPLKIPYGLTGLVVPGSFDIAAIVTVLVQSLLDLPYGRRARVQRRSGSGGGFLRPTLARHALGSEVSPGLLLSLLPLSLRKFLLSPLFLLSFRKFPLSPLLFLSLRKSLLRHPNVALAASENTRYQPAQSKRADQTQIDVSGRLESIGLLVVSYRLRNRFSPLAVHLARIVTGLAQLLLNDAQASRADKNGSALPFDPLLVVSLRTPPLIFHACQHLRQTQRLNCYQVQVSGRFQTLLSLERHQSLLGLIAPQPVDIARIVSHSVKFLLHNSEAGGTDIEPCAAFHGPCLRDSLASLSGPSLCGNVPRAHRQRCEHRACDFKVFFCIHGKSPVVLVVF